MRYSLLNLTTRAKFIKQLKKKIFNLTGAEQATWVRRLSLAEDN